MHVEMMANQAAVSTQIACKSLELNLVLTLYILALSTQKSKTKE
jgi:hypothetical protein